MLSARLLAQQRMEPLHCMGRRAATIHGEPSEEHPSPLTDLGHPSVAGEAGRGASTLGYPKWPCGEKGNRDHHIMMLVISVAASSELRHHRSCTRGHEWPKPTYMTARAEL